ncbi:AbrB/MazE/SpoVT family DNA-binding domain-containing protein [Candidatus Pacearchaeota archaeon]|nr:AbrB/MazE/SpoVT family DNA-binding domain-containing protein [Candidatus Pacearchaeota archaeon]
MNRKILQVGPSTLAVSLPSSWTKKFNIKKGEELTLEEQGNSLRIKTSSPIEEESAKINVSLLHPFSTKIIGMLYRAGYKKIKAIYTPNKTVTHRGKQLKELDMIQNTFDHLTGMQLWELGNEKEYYATIIESAKVNPKEFENILNKLYLHLIHQSEQIYNALLNNKDSFDEAYLTERLINQAQDFCIRILASHGHEDHKKTLHYNNLIYKLESIGDKYFQIALSHHKNKEKINPETLQYIEKAIAFIKESISLCRKFNFEKITSLIKELNESIKNYQEEIKKQETKSTLISFNIYSILLEIYEIIEILFFLNHTYFKE